MNTTLHPYIFYRAHDDQGRELPPPTRNVVEAPIQSLTEGAAQEIDDMKATAGIFDPSLGQQSNEQSGLAIQRRQQQSNLTNMHFMDNLERAFKKGGLIIAEVMPKIYDAERMVRILGEDETPKIVKINSPHTINGKTVHYKVGGESAQKDEPIVTVGRTFDSKRMESFDMMTSVLQTSPNLLPMIGDIFFRNSDMAGADQLAERFKKMLPPNLQDNDATDPASQVSALQAQLQKASTHLQAINAYAQKLEQDRDGRIEIAKMQEETKRIGMQIDQATKLAVSQMNSSKDANESIAQREIKVFDILHGAAADAATQAQDQAHERNMATMQHEQALEQGQQAAQNQQVLAAQNQAAQQQQPAQ